MTGHSFAKLTIVALTAFSILPAAAEVTAGDAIERYRLGDPGMFTFFSGNLNGFIWANLELRSKSHNELFCVPPASVISVQQAVDVMLKHIKDNPSDGRRPVGSLMLQTLTETFPCK
jgi:Rap1a immunity proteins